MGASLTDPPRGWDDPHQGGTLTVDDETAVFTDEEGHRETFRLREGATAPKTVCS